MKRILCIFLMLVLLLGSVTVQAGAAGKVQTNRDIAVVYDNSGSMFESGQLAWCRATYAMEVFAAMMNEGDTMRIYPMHPVKIDNTTYDEAHPVTISGPKDAELVRRMYTPDAQGTPVQTIDAAHEGLKNASGERWLIVLTDGERFSDENDRELDHSATEQMLSERLSRYNQDMNVLYLGIGTGAAMPTVTENGQYQFDAEQASESGEVLSKLTSMCNMIFGRDTMPASGSTLEFDVSMKKLIVFVQGKDISGVSVTDGSGKEIGQKTDEHGTHYSDLGAGGANHGNAVDENLQGMVVTYVSEYDRKSDSGQKMPAGRYQLNYSGDASSITAYYEPDVDLVVQLVDEAGNVLQGVDDAYEGSYTLRYGLLDNQTGEMTESPLLGNTHYDVEYSVNGETFSASSNQKFDETSISLKANDTLNATITAEYLSGYRITKSGPDFGWPELGFHIIPMTVDVDKLDITITGGSDEYKLSRLEEDGVYHLTAVYDGEQLSGEDVDRIQIMSNTDGNIKVEAVRSGDGYDLCLRYNDDPTHTDVGEFNMETSVVYTNSDGESGKKTAPTQHFKVVDDGYGLGVRIEQTQKFYQSSKLDEGEPMIIRLTKDGAPLTDEELSAVQLDIDADGLDFETEMMAGESAYSLRLKPTDSQPTGKHTVVCRASALNPLGEPIEGKDSAKVELQKYPNWLRWLVAGLIAALLLALILLFLNKKVLPKKVIRAGDSEFSIGGKNINGIAKLAYKRDSKSLELTRPDAPAYPYTSCSAKLLLAPV
nr:hypothetical protein [Clostridiales bacterium]